MMHNYIYKAHLQFYTRYFRLYFIIDRFEIFTVITSFINVKPLYININNYIKLYLQWNGLLIKIELDMQSYDACNISCIDTLLNVYQ